MRETNLPTPIETQAKPRQQDSSMRLKDLAMTVELLCEVVAEPSGARKRVCDRHGIQNSVVTDRLQRVEAYFEVELFARPQRNSPSYAGQRVAEYGPRLLREIDHFAEMLRSTRDGKRLA